MLVLFHIFFKPWFQFSCSHIMCFFPISGQNYKALSIKKVRPSLYVLNSVGVVKAYASPCISPLLFMCSVQPHEASEEVTAHKVLLFNKSQTAHRLATCPHFNHAVGKCFFLWKQNLSKAYNRVQRTITWGTCCITHYGMVEYACLQLMSLIIMWQLGLEAHIAHKITQRKMKYIRQHSSTRMFTEKKRHFNTCCEVSWPAVYLIWELKLNNLKKKNKKLNNS